MASEDFYANALAEALGITKEQAKVSSKIFENF